MKQSLTITKSGVTTWITPLSYVFFLLFLTSPPQSRRLGCPQALGLPAEPAADRH